MAERRINCAAAADEEWRKTALDASKGHVFSIAWAFGDGPIDCHVAPNVPAESDVCGDGEMVVTRWTYDEPALLRRFFTAIDPTYSLDPGSLIDEDSQEIVERLRDRNYFGNTTTADLSVKLSRPRIVAHHADFDIRFLWQRAVILGVRVPIWWPINVPTWKQDRIFCTMAAWAGAGGRIGLDHLCKALGLPGKTGFDSSQVWDAVRDGRIGEVIEYNVGDVHRLRACFRKLNFLPTPAEVAA